MKVDVAGREVHLSSLDRVLWPETGTTKAQLIEYVSVIGELMIPHVASHPVTLHRFPEGVDGPHFFQTRAPSHPEWVRAVTLRSPTAKVFDVVVLDDLASLVWAANISAIEVHPFLGTADAFDRPTMVVFDLDPGPPADLATCCEVALHIRDLLDTLGLRVWAKASGAKGLHLHVPVDGSGGFEHTKSFARAVAELASRALPTKVVTTMARERRTGRVFIDWSQNTAWKSMIAPYSLRGLPYPTVAAPVSWPEVEHVASTGDVGALVFFASDMQQRVATQGDLFADVAATRQTLPTAAA
jgi:bifunctional non-homologous end joining protein LigD